MLSRRRFLAALSAGPLTAADWSAYRGTGDGISDAKNLPLEWGPQKNVAWSVELPGSGTSAPVVFREIAYVASSTSEAGKDFLLATAVDLKTGARRWTKRMPASRSGLAGQASLTPAVEAGRVFLFFASGDFTALDFDGNMLWTRRLSADLGPLNAPQGAAAGVRRSREHAIVFASREASSFLLAVDPQTGKTDWVAERPYAAHFWESPVITQSWQREVVTLAVEGRLEGFSGHDGQLLWRREGLPPAAAASTPAELPRTGEGVVLVPFSTPAGLGCYKLLPAGREPLEVWRSAAPCSGPALAFDGVVYAIDGAGLLVALDLQTGAQLWTAPLGGAHLAPPLAAADRVYFFRRDGACTVLASGRKLARLALNAIDPAGDLYAAVPFDGGFLLRTPNRLLRIGAGAAAKPRHEWRPVP